MEAHETRSFRIAVIILSLDFLYHTLLLLFVEPGMGFRSMTDYFNTSLATSALSTTPWLLSNVFHMAGGIAIAQIGIHFSRTGSIATSITSKVSGFSGLLFFVVGISGFVGLNLTNWLSSDTLDIALISLFTFRYTLLLAAIITLAIFIALSGWIGSQNAVFASWFRYACYGVAVILLAFLFIPIPVPLVLFIWSILLALLYRTGNQ